MGAIERLRTRLDASERSQARAARDRRRGVPVPGRRRRAGGVLALPRRGRRRGPQIPDERWPRRRSRTTRRRGRRPLLDGDRGHRRRRSSASRRERPRRLDPRRLPPARDRVGGARGRRHPGRGRSGATATGRVRRLQRARHYSTGRSRAARRASTPTARSGNLLSTAAGRVSYALGLQGPCVSVDTACSSSLVSIAPRVPGPARRRLRRGARGRHHALLSPYSMAVLAARRGSRRTAAARRSTRANGFVRGEGAGDRAEAPLGRAARRRPRPRGDPGLGGEPGRPLDGPHDAERAGAAGPSAPGAGARAVAPDEVGYVEMHGTGTPLGDPIEASCPARGARGGRARMARVRAGRGEDELGHLEAAAGRGGADQGGARLEHERIPEEPALPAAQNPQHPSWTGRRSRSRRSACRGRAAPSGAWRASARSG